jgi:hypothetical protein
MRFLVLLMILASFSTLAQEDKGLSQADYHQLLNNIQNERVADEVRSCFQQGSNLAYLRHLHDEDRERLFRMNSLNLNRLLIEKYPLPETVAFFSSHPDYLNYPILYLLIEKLRTLETINRADYLREISRHLPPDLPPPPLFLGLDGPEVVMYNTDVLYLIHVFLGHEFDFDKYKGQGVFSDDFVREAKSITDFTLGRTAESNWQTIRELKALLAYLSTL